MINTASQTESTPGSITGQPSPTGSIAGQPSPTQSPTVVPGTPGKNSVQGHSLLSGYYDCLDCQQVKIVKCCQNCPISQKLSKILTLSRIVYIVNNCQNYKKMSKIVQKKLSNGK